MLGRELHLLLERQGLPVTGTGRELDITDAPALDSYAARQHGLDWIVNCAAYTAVDRAEDDAEACRSLNVEGPGNLARTARNAGAALIHLSTDYVFDGRGAAPYREDDETRPTGVYGLSKRDGERAALAENPDTWIIRSSWLYGSYGNNFVHTMLRLMKERGGVTVVDDQRGSPTWTRDLASAICALITRKAAPPGIYHYAGSGNCTWFDFARAIYGLARERRILAGECAVNPCASGEFPSRVRRPAYSVLDTSKFRKALGLAIPPWRESLAAYLDEYKVQS
jgi:dTDP-4-dehydrorhamnose reductase